MKLSILDIGVSVNPVNSLSGKTVNIFSGYNGFNTSISCLAIVKITIDLPNFSLTKEDLKILH